MRNHGLVFFLFMCLTLFGVWALTKMNKDEFPFFTIRQGVVIPAACVQVTTEGKSVWVVQEDSTAVRRRIQIGQYVPNGVLVTDGLQTGDRVVTDGFQKLYKGAKVKEI